MLSLASSAPCTACPKPLSVPCCAVVQTVTSSLSQIGTQGVSVHLASVSCTLWVFLDRVTFSLSKTATNYWWILDLQYGYFLLKKRVVIMFTSWFLPLKLSFSLSLSCHKKHRLATSQLCLLSCVSGEASLNISVIMIWSQFSVTPSPYPPCPFLCAHFIFTLLGKLSFSKDHFWTSQVLAVWTLLSGTVYLVFLVFWSPGSWSLPSNMFVLLLVVQFLGDVKMLGRCRLVTLSVSVVFHFIVVQLASAEDWKGI